MNPRKYIEQFEYKEQFYCPLFLSFSTRWNIHFVERIIASKYKWRYIRVIKIEKLIFVRLWCIVVDWNNEKLDENRLSKHVKSNESPIIIVLSVAYRYSIKTRLIIFSKTKVDLSNLNSSCATNKNLHHLKTTSV